MKITTRKVLLFLIDLFIIIAISAAAYLILPLSGSVQILSADKISKIAIDAALLLLCRILFGVYRSVWRYADASSYLNLILADITGSCGVFIIGRLVTDLNPGAAFIGITNSIILLLTLCSRFAYQLYYAQRNLRKESDGRTVKQKRIAIIGAGNIGSALASELQRNPRSNYAPACFIDTDKNKIGNSVNGIKILPENSKTLEKLGSTVEEIIIAIPDAGTDLKAKLYDKYRKTGLPVKVYDYPVGNSVEDSKRAVREIKIEDLLFRDSIKLDKSRARAYYKDKVILVTGGGGSIGSELCRQIAKCAPKKLIIVDIYENNAYDIQQELIRKYGRDALDLEVIIASVRDRARIGQIFETFRPQIVFHAAAHKHVPLMEDSPMEAIKNNVFGTKNVADMAEEYGCEKFVLISTDKAVNPTNIMGASKRLCEMIVQCRTDSPTDFTAVRFGNVLGSNGSVIPLFKRQIEAGGPVTITDKRIIRYFMTISEAVSLVMETGVFAKDGELFVLDMGKPVKILELAEKMIQLSGFEPYKDIEIKEIGLRPGEKLYEELLIKNEDADLGKTDNDLIFIEHDKAKPADEINSILEELSQAAGKNDCEAVFAAVKDTVPTYQPKHN